MATDYSRIAKFITPGKEKQAEKIAQSYGGTLRSSGGSSNRPKNILGQELPTNDSTVTAQNVGSLLSYLSPYMTPTAQKNLSGITSSMQKSLQAGEPIDIPTLQKYAGNVPQIPQAPLPELKTPELLALGTQQKGVQDTQKEVQSYLDQVFAQPERTDVRQQAMEASGYLEAKRRANELSARIGALQANQQAEVAQATSQIADEGGTTFGLSSREAAIDRKYATKLLPLTAQYQAELGNLDTAKEIMNAYIADENAYLDRYYSWQQNVGNKVWDLMTTKQKREWELQDQATAQKIDTIKSNRSFVQSLYADNVKDNPEIAKIASGLMQYVEDPNFSTIAQNKLSVVGGGSGTNAGGQYSGIINTILGSGKFTQAQASMIRNSIANGEDPVTVIKNQAKNILGTEGKELTKYESARDAMIKLDSEIKAFYDAGGSSGIFSGNFEKVTNKLGGVNDPGLVSLAVQIAGSLQKYRNAISGTAYSEQEGKDIAAIFPGITKGELLNSTIVKARLETLNSDIDSMYSNVLGNAYYQLPQTQYTPPVDTTGMSDDDAYNEYLKATGNAPAPTTTTQTTIAQPRDVMSSLAPQFSQPVTISGLKSFFK